MKILSFINSFIEGLGLLSGVGIAIITIFTTLEAVLRYVFNSPTTWSLSLSTYIFLWILFLGSSYSFKTKSHVRVEMFLEYLERRNKIKLKRIIALIGYLLTTIYLSILTWFGFSSTLEAYKGDWTTQNSFPIPDFILYLGIAVGSLLMIMTIIYIVINILKKDDYYLTGEDS